jgi:hypothetical protein
MTRQGSVQVGFCGVVKDGIKGLENHSQAKANLRAGEHASSCDSSGSRRLESVVRDVFDRGFREPF